MSFFGSSPTAELVSKCTSEYLISADWGLIMETCDMVNNTVDGAKDAVSRLRKRLKNSNPKVQLLSLTLAEALVRNCGFQLHQQIASRDFMERVMKLVDRQGVQRDLHVYRKALELIQLWGLAFRDKRSQLPLFNDVYESLKRKGHSFEPPSDENVAQLISDVADAEQRRGRRGGGSHPQSYERRHAGGSRVAAPGQQSRQEQMRAQQLQAQQTRQQQQQRHPQHHQQQQQQQQQQQHRRAAAQDPAEVERKLQKDLSVVRETTSLFAQLLAAHPPSEDPNSNEVLTELASTCREMAPRLMRLISEESARISPSLLELLLELNDDVHRCLDNHKKLLEGEAVDADTLARQIAEEGLAERERLGRTGAAQNAGQGQGPDGVADLLGLAGDAPPATGAAPSATKPSPTALTQAPVASRPTATTTSSSTPSSGSSAFALAPPPSAGRAIGGGAPPAPAPTASQDVDLIGGVGGESSSPNAQAPAANTTTNAPAAAASSNMDDLLSLDFGGSSTATTQQAAPAAASNTGSTNNNDLLGMFATPAASAPAAQPQAQANAQLDPFAAMMATPTPQQPQAQAQTQPQAAPAPVDDFDSFFNDRATKNQ